MEGKLRLPQKPLTALQQMVSQLHRLTGAKLKIARMQRLEDDESLDLEGAVTVRFMNRGQKAVMLDDQILLLPGEVYVEGDTAGPGIDHPYRVQFIDVPKDGVPAPAAQIPYVYPGAFLDIRIMYRIY